MSIYCRSNAASSFKAKGNAQVNGLIHSPGSLNSDEPADKMWLPEIVLEYSDLSKGQELVPSVSRLKHRVQVNDYIFLKVLLELQLTQEEIKGVGLDYNSKLHPRLHPPPDL